MPYDVCMVDVEMEAVLGRLKWSCELQEQAGDLADCASDNDGGSEGDWNSRSGTNSDATVLIRNLDDVALNAELVGVGEAVLAGGRDSG
eukprot:ANDGO_03283.mRNA.1 hypothetical protein